MAAFDEGCERLGRLIADAAAGEQDWRGRVRAVAAAALAFFDEQPGWARLLLDDAALKTRALSQRRRDALGALAHALASQTQTHANDAGWFLPSCELTAELVIGGVSSALHTHLLERSDRPFATLAPALVAFIQAPYQAAGFPSETFGARVDSKDLGALRLPVRTTYRTTRVLCAIGESPGLSNREIADAAGLIDEGQTSKLLRRLQRRGLLENMGLGQPYGGPNAWSLTAYGERVRDATRHSLVPGAGAATGRRVRGAA